MDIGPTELVIILLIVAILFGGSRISQLGGELGSAIHAFRQALQDPDSKATKSEGSPSEDQDPNES
jgi:sec-independent protein translocase protein TatA